MRKIRHLMVAAGALALALPSVASAAKADKVSICHWDEDAQLFKVISVSGNAVASHMANHGDTTPGTWYTDADGDGFGDPNGATDPCPNAGFVASNDDCNDGDAAINPGAAEVCGDTIDNNCSGAADEGCASCPCFTTADLDAANAQWQADSETYQQSTRTCDDVNYDNSGYYYWWYAYNYVHIYFENWNYSNDYYYYWYDYKVKQFYSLDYDDYYDATYCNAYSYDSNGNYTQDFQYITEADHEQCTTLLRNWAAGNNLTCNVYTYTY